MTGAMQTRISIYADDKASASFRKVAGEADSLVNKLLGMGPKVGDVLGNLGLGSLGLGLGVKELTGFIKDSSLAAARYQTLGLAMFKAGENAGYNAEQMSKAERELVKHGIALQDSRQILAQFATSNLEVARSGELARAAQDVAVSANTDSSAALQKMVHAIVSAQPEMLRTLGLAVSFEQAYAKAAQSMGKNVSALTEAEKMQVRFNATLEAAAGYAGIYELSMTTASKQLGSFTRHWSNFQTLLGEVTLDSLSTAVFGVNDSLESLNNRLMDMKESGELEQVSRKIGNAIGTIADNADTAAIALALWYTAVKVGNTATVQRIQSLSREHGVMATLREEIAGNTAMLGKDTAAYIANTQAAIANHKARLSAIDAGIGAKQSVIAEIATPEYATNLEAIRHRRTLEREVKMLQAERVVVSRQLTQATDAMTAATNRGNVALRAMNSLKAGASNLVSMFGGPWVLGLTAATAVLYHLATQENEATKYAREHADAMQLVSQNADVAKAALERYSTKLSEMNESQRAFEQADLQRSINDIISGGAAYRSAYWAMSPKIYSERTAEIRSRVQPLAELLLPGNFDKVTIDQLKEARNQYAALSAEIDRTKEVAEQLQMYDALISLKQQAEVASVAVQKIGDNAKDAVASLQDLASINFANLTANVEFEIGKIGLNDRNRAVLDSLIRNKVVEQQNVQLDGKEFAMTGLTPSAEQKVQALAGAYGTLFDRQQAARGSAKSLQSSLAGLNNELARLTMTEQEYARYQYERKFADLRKDLGSTSPALAEWARLQELALNAGYANSTAALTHVREISKAISEMGLTEKEKQLKAFNEEMARLQAFMPGVQMSFPPEQFGAYQSQKTREILTGRNVDRDRQSLIDFEKEFLSVMQNSEAAQIASIRERAAEYAAAGADAVRVAQWKTEMELRYSRDAFAGLKVGLRNYSNEATNMAKNTSAAITGVFDSLGNVFSFQCGRMKMDWSNMLDTMMNQAWKALVMNPLLGALSKGLESFVGGFLGGGTGAATTGAEVKHTGGIVGAGTMHRNVPLFLFADAPRYHSGGKILKPGEVPVIAEAGERMLTKKENRLWESMMRGGAAGGPVELSVILKNESGQPLQAKSNQTQWANDLRSAVVTIVIDAVSRNYMGARDALRG